MQVSMLHPQRHKSRGVGARLRAGGASSTRRGHDAGGEPMAVYRTFLFAPGNHPRRVEKALSLDADAVILDLEDACPIAEKKATRAVVVAACQRPRTGLGYVRVNATSDRVRLWRHRRGGAERRRRHRPAEGRDGRRDPGRRLGDREPRDRAGSARRRVRRDPDHRDGQGHGQHPRHHGGRHARQAHRLRRRRLHARHGYGVDPGRDRAAALSQRMRARLACGRHRGARSTPCGWT